MVWWIASWHLGGFFDYSMPEKDISSNYCRWACGVFRTWPGWSIKSGAPSGAREQLQCTLQCTSSTKAIAIFSTSRASSWFEVVADQVSRRSCGYTPHVCWNGQCWTHRNAAQIPGFMKSVCIGNYTQSGWKRPKSYSCKRCIDNWAVQGMEYPAAGICMSSPARVKLSTSHIITERGSWKLCSPREWSPSTLLSCLNNVLA